VRERSPEIVISTSVVAGATYSRRRNHPIPITGPSSRHRLVPGHVCPKQERGRRETWCRTGWKRIGRNTPRSSTTEASSVVMVRAVRPCPIGRNMWL